MNEALASAIATLILALAALIKVVADRKKAAADAAAKEEVLRQRTVASDYYRKQEVLLDQRLRAIEEKSGIAHEKLDALLATTDLSMAGMDAETRAKAPDPGGARPGEGNP